MKPTCVAYRVCFPSPIKTMHAPLNVRWEALVIALIIFLAFYSRGVEIADVRDKRTGTNFTVSMRGDSLGTLILCACVVITSSIIAAAIALKVAPLPEAGE